MQAAHPTIGASIHWCQYGAMQRTYAYGAPSVLHGCYWLAAACMQGRSAEPAVRFLEQCDRIGIGETHERWI
eukprot:COSAG01_NODE_1658_length_9590_cov_6.038984_5_plen_72_part_00